MKTIIEELRPFKAALKNDQELLSLEIKGVQQILSRSGGNFLSYSAFMEEVNNKERQGMSIDVLLEEQKRLKESLYDLNDGAVKPSKIIGTGYIKPRNVAYTYLYETAVINAVDVCSSGYTSYINLRNYLTYVTKLSKD